jgi:hypothetical protein
MIDFDVLTDYGTTRDRLRQFFTAKLPSVTQQQDMDKKELKALRKDVENRKKFEQMVSAWFQEHVVYSLKNHTLFSAVDLAWDSVPINRQIYPLLQYAQGRIDVTRAAQDLAKVPGGESYVKKNDSGQVVGVDLPKFTEMNVNLIRSVITRRVAAQDSKYDLWPWFRYEPRSTTQVGKLRGDLASQRMDIMADQYDYRHFQTQIIRNMLLYTTAVAFPRAAWERDVQVVKASYDPALAYDVDSVTGEKKLRKKTVTVREGISWVSPHPSRIFYDNQYPLTSLNSDTGCEYVGFWDVLRWGDIASNPDYFNRDCVGFSSNTAAWFSQYWMYFNQYFDRIIPPNIPNDPSDSNDRKLNIGLYTREMNDVATFFTHVWVKVVPRQWRWGNYPNPIWVHLKVAGDHTVVYADIMPSSPAAVASFNSNDNRLTNISLAHELMQFQDQLTNLYSELLETIKADLFRVAILNEDVFPDTKEGKEVLAEFKKQMKGRAYYSEPVLLCASLEKLGSLMGRQVTADMVFQVVRSSPNTQITALFQAITHVVNMAERLMVMSAHEQGQAASHELTATESSQIGGSTETMYAFISKPVDEFRGAQKRICFDSVMASGEDMVELPVSNRYPDAIISKAGFEVKDKDEDDPTGIKLVYGSKYSLIHDFIFTSRDGGNRSANSQSAQVLVQLMQAIFAAAPPVQNAILSAMGKSKVFEVFNNIFRLADAGVDLKLSVRPGEGDNLLVEDDQQVMGIINQLAQHVKQDAGDLQQIKAAMAKFQEQMQQRGAARESIQINYKDAPPSIQRQMESTAGFHPATELGNQQWPPQPGKANNDAG